MKKLLSLLFVISTSFVCAQTVVVDSCNVLSKDYIFSKSRVIEVKNRKQVNDAAYSIILSKGTTYIFTACKKEDSKSDMEIQLLDSKDRILLTNFSSEKRKYFNKVSFVCNASGTYFVKYIFDGNSLPGKGESTIGYKVPDKKKSKAH